MGHVLTETVRRLVGEEQRYVVLSSGATGVGDTVQPATGDPSTSPLPVLALAIVPDRPPGAGIVVAWPTNAALGFGGIAQISQELFDEYWKNRARRPDDVNFECWIEDTYFSSTIAAPVQGPVLFQEVQKRLVTPRDRVQLIKIGVDDVSIEWTFDSHGAPSQAAVVIDEVRLRGLLPCISNSHDDSRVYSDREILLQLLHEPGQFSNALHFLRPAKVHL